jgi:hypothetical protein
MYTASSGRLCIWLPLLLAATGCQANERGHQTGYTLDCERRDRPICAAIAAIRELPSGPNNLKSYLPPSEQVELDVTAIRKGMRDAAPSADRM